MATIASNGTGGGPWSVGTSWAGGTAPVIGDKVNIVSPDNITVDNTSCRGGDDTSTAINVKSGATLSFSRTANTKLVCRGELVLENGSTLNMGTSASPIPSAYTAEIVLNDSASPADGKWGMTALSGAATSYRWIYGAYKKVNTRLVSDISASATSARIEDGTGWAVGDTIVFGPTGTSTSEQDVKTISTITLVSGTEYDITWSGGVSYEHKAKGYVGNFTHNITIGSASTTYKSYWYEEWTTTQGVNSMEFRNFTMRNCTNVGGAFKKQAGLTFYTTSSVTLVNPFISIGDISFYNSSSQGTFLQFGNNKGRLYLSDIAMYQSAAGSSILCYQGAVHDITRLVIYKGGTGLKFEYSQGSQNPRFYDCIFTGCSNMVVSSYGAIQPYFYNCHFWSNVGLVDMGVANELFIENCYFGSGGETPSGARDTQTYLVTAPNGAIGHMTLKNCKINAYYSGIIYDSAYGYQRGLPTLKTDIVNKNNDVTSQEIYYPTGCFFRDNSVISRGKSSIRLETRTSIATSFPAIPIPAPNGVAVTVKARMRKNSSYGSSSRPTVQLSGLGITPVTYTMTDSVDTWEDFTLTATQTSGSDGELSLVFTGQSSNTSGKAWLDGIYVSPFVTSVDHYGYTYDPTNNIRTVDPIITQTTEATVAAYTGISISSGTITLTSNHTIQELYDYCQYYRANNQVSQFFTSADGVNFSCSYNLTLNGGNLTGTGNISMPTKTFTRTASETSSVIITHSAGTFTNISVSNIVTGSRMRIWNETDNIEIANEIAASSSYWTNFAYTADKTIWLYLTYTNGTTAKLPYSASGVISASGVSFLASQEDDTVYNGNAVNGSLVSYFTADYPNIQVDISSGTTFIVQQLYAWFEYIQTTANGIRYFFGGLTAQDEFNYIVNTNIVDLMLDNTSGSNITMTNGYLSRDDGSSYIYSLTANSIVPIYDRAYIADNSAISSKINYIASTIGDTIE